MRAAAGAGWSACCELLGFWEALSAGINSFLKGSFAAAQSCHFETKLPRLLRSGIYGSHLIIFVWNCVLLRILQNQTCWSVKYNESWKILIFHLNYFYTVFIFTYFKNWHIIRLTLYVHIQSNYLPEIITHCHHAPPELLLICSIWQRYKILGLKGR